MASDNLIAMLRQSGGLGQASPSLTFNPRIPDGDSWLSSFGQSTGENFLEFWGKDKSPETIQWEAGHPVGSTISSVLGYGANLVGGELAFNKVLASEAFPVLGRFMGALGGGVEARPVVATALQSMAKLAPVEGARIATSLAIGEQPWQQPLTNAATDLAATGLITGGLKGIGQYGKASRTLQDIVPGADATLPPQLQMRAAKEFLATNADPELANTINNRLAQFQRAVRLEEPSAGAKYVSDFEGTSSKDINRLFHTGTGKDLDRYQLVQGSKGFADGIDDAGKTLSAQKQIEDTWAKTGFPPLRDSAAFIQYPRVAEATSTSGGKFVEQSVLKGMQNVGDGTFIAREKGEGLFVIAKKIDGQAGTGAAGDRWVMLKTDTPGRFLPQAEDFAQKVAKRTAWLMKDFEPQAATGSVLADFAGNLSQKFPLVNYLSLGEGSSKLALGARALAKKSGLTEVAGGAAETFGNFFDRYIKPTVYQFSRSPRANWIFGMSRATYDEGAKAARVLMHGESKLQGTNLWKASVSKVEGETSIKGLLDKLDEGDLTHVWKAWNEQWDLGQMKQALSQGKFSQGALNFLSHMSEVDKKMIGELKATQQLYGEPLFSPMENHFMISRTWTGDWRVPIHNEDGQLVYMASGKTKAGAELQAKKIIQGTERQWSNGTAMLADRTAEAPISLAGYLDEMKMNPDYLAAAKANENLLRTAKPTFMNERQNIGGYAGQVAPWTKSELQANIMSHLEQQQRYMAGLVTNAKFGPDLYRLSAEDPAMFHILTDRLNDLAGKAGPIGQLTNQVVDKILSPVLGKNSATKIVTTTNQLFMHFNLGALNLGQGILNGLQFAQTVIPETAFVLNALPERLARYYNIFPVAGSDGLVRGSVHALDPLRIMKQSVGEMSRPTPMLLKQFERAISDGVISPKLMEDYLGESSTKVTQLKAALQEGNFSGWLRNLSEVFLTGSEKLSRGNAFTVGHIIGRDFLSLADDQLYMFAKKFTQRSMYGYSTVDRARVFTTPVGSALGLFKNWMMHYMGSMLEYTSEGALRGNWSPLLWQLAGTGAIGGAVSTGPAFLLADKFSRMASDKSLMDNIYDLTGGTSRDNLLTGSLNANLSDALFLGLPSLFGVSLAAQSETPGGNPAKDITFLMQFTYLNRMNALAKATGTALDTMGATGHNPLSDSTVQDQFAKALLPKTVYRVMAGWQENAIRSLNTHNPILKDASLGERVAYMTGLNPLVVERNQRVADELWASKDKMSASVSAYGRAFYEAQQAGDFRATQNIMLRAMGQGMDFSRVLKSAASLDAKQRKGQLERQFSPEELWKKRNVLGK